MEFRKGDEKVIRAEVANRLRKSIEADQGKLKGQRKLSNRQREDIEKHEALKFAKDNGLWIDNFYSLGIPAYGGGNENTLALDANSGFLYKSNNLYNSFFSISHLLKQIDIHNSLFPETGYELVGFTGIDNGNNRPPYVEVVIRQPFIENVDQAAPVEIASFMKSLDFEQINETSFVNSQYLVSDLYPRNVLKDEEGIIYVVDNIISESKIEFKI